ncbi:hypothetical protein ACKKBG_A07235 [Auxenochlorella protothecoides x Auxenochlorella symbiontica]
MAIQDHFDVMEDDDAASVSGISSILSAHTPERGGVDPTASGRAIEAALEEAEQLMRLGSATHTGIRSAGKKSLSSIIDASEQLRQQVRDLRIENHEAKVELVTLRAQLAQKESTAQRIEHEASQQIAERDRVLAELSAANAANQEKLAALSAQATASSTLSPSAAARLRSEHAAAITRAARSAQAAADLQERMEASAARAADAMRCWTGVRDGLQREAGRLAAALERKTAEAQDLLQEREILRAKVALLGGATQKRSAWEPEDAEVARWRQRAESLEHSLREREGVCHKYKLAIRALKAKLTEAEERQAGLKRGAQERELALHGLIVRLQRQAEDKEIAARTAAAQLATPPASPQRLPAQAAVPAQAATLQQQVPASQQADLECLRETAATWEERAREAEHRTEAAVRAADAAAAAAVRLADRRTSAAEAKARAAILEAQSLRAQLEVGLAAAREQDPGQELAGALRSAGLELAGEDAEAYKSPLRPTPAAAADPAAEATGAAAQGPAPGDWASELGRHEETLKGLEARLAGAPLDSTKVSPARPGQTPVREGDERARLRNLGVMLDRLAEKQVKHRTEAPRLIQAA